MDKFKGIYRIPAARASWHDYKGGAYFVTICTAGRVHYFGEIDNGVMTLSVMGKAVTENLKNITHHYPYAEIPLYVVMPNHIHAVVIIDGDKYHNGNVETMCTSSLQAQQSTKQQRWKTETVDDKMRQISHKRGTLSVMIGGLKRAITCVAHQNNIPFAWQSRFHDHIIRDQDEMNRIAEYVENNIAKWDLDKFNDVNNQTNNI